MYCPSFRIWGYETSWGSFAQFTRVQAHQCVPKPEAGDRDPITLGLQQRLEYRLAAPNGSPDPGRRRLGSEPELRVASAASRRGAISARAEASLAMGFQPRRSPPLRPARKKSSNRRHIVFQQP